MTLEIIERDVKGLCVVEFEGEDWFAFEMDNTTILFKETEDGRVKIQTEQ